MTPIKQIHISILDPAVDKILASPQIVEISDNGDLIEAIAAFDRKFFDHSKENPISRQKILDEREAKSLLHMLWNPRQNALYPNIGLEARGPQMKWIPLKDNMDLTLPPDSSIIITVDAGC
jgi:hypothetical protein